MRRFMFIALLVGVTGCASSGVRHVATVSVVSAHAVLAATQDTEMLLVCGKPGAPAAPACVPLAEHKVISAKLADAFGVDVQVATIIRDWPATGAAPTSIGALLGQITVVVNYVLDHLPPGALTTKLLTVIGGAK